MSVSTGTANFWLLTAKISLLSYQVMMDSDFSYKALFSLTDGTVVATICLFQYP